MRDIIIISAERPGMLRAERAKATFEMAQDLANNGIVFRPLEGSWNGRAEACFAIPRNDNTFRVALALADKYLQDAVLVVNDQRSAVVIDACGRPRGDGGVLVPVLRPDNPDTPYTYDNVTGQFFVLCRRAVNEAN